MKPKILDELDKKVSATEDVDIEDILPVDADTLGGQLPEYYAPKTYVAKTISDYLSSILGRSY